MARLKQVQDPGSPADMQALMNEADEAGGMPEAPMMPPPPVDTKLREPTSEGGEFSPGFDLPGRGEEGPRERPSGGGGGGTAVAPRRPSEPTSQAGSQFSNPQPLGPAAQQGVLPFAPMPQANVGSFATPNQGGLYGSAGGLQGGGLGVPFDPISDAASDPISGLLELLMQGRR
jgi:hypothetical protein